VEKHLGFPFIIQTLKLEKPILTLNHYSCLGILQEDGALPAGGMAGFMIG
tara:strand:- start:455 stop:604 length:150 start_codon:yes stop_codon:yes gene_type:complete